MVGCEFWSRQASILLALLPSPALFAALCVCLATACPQGLDLEVIKADSKRGLLWVYTSRMSRPGSLCPHGLRLRFAAIALSQGALRSTCVRGARDMRPLHIAG